MSDWRKYIAEGVLLPHLTTDIAVKQTECGMRLDCDARKLLAAALFDPQALQAKLLDLAFDRAAVHQALCVSLSPRSDLAAHQLVAACREAGLLGNFAD